MSYQYHGTTGLIALPGRSMQTFPSGMIRVDRSYLCRKGLEANFREQFAVGNDLPLDDSAPAIDGLKIYPEVQEIYRDDGFVEFRASAYGRKNLDGKVEYRYGTGNATAIIAINTFEFDREAKSYVPITINRSSPIPDRLIIKNTIVYRCIPIDEAPETGRTLQGDVFFADTNQPIQSRAYSKTQLAAQLFPLLFESRDYVYNPSAFSDEVRLQKTIEVSGIEVKSFGQFQEIRETYLTDVSDISLGVFQDVKVRLQFEEVVWEEKIEARYVWIAANFRRPLNSDTFAARINISGSPGDIVFEQGGINYGGATIDTGYFDLRILASSANNGQDCVIRFESTLPESMSNLRIVLFAEGENQQSVELSRRTWVI